MKPHVARVRPGVLLLLLTATTAAAPTRSCSDSGSPNDGGAEGAASGQGDVPDASTMDAGAAAAGDAAGQGVEAPASDASTADAGQEAAQEAGVAPTGADAAGVTLGPVWANWPMPNPPSTGLPNPQSYDTSVTGIVKDKVTGLMWQQTDILAAGYPTVQDAAAYCAGLTLGGYADWRLPSRVEVWSIDDTSSSSPAMDPSFATVAANVPAGSVDAAPWTTSLGHGAYSFPGEGDSVSFEQGDQSVSSVSGTAIDGGGSLRCVRGSTAQPSPHYTVQNGTVFDNGTRLTWQQGYSSAQMLPNGVAGYCAGLSLSGGGWRAPSVKELETLVNDAVVAPALDTSVFSLPPAVDGGPPDWAFYTSSPVVGVNDAETRDVLSLVCVDGTGTNDLEFVYESLTANFHWVRCVR